MGTSTLDVRNIPLAKTLFYAVGFTIYESCKLDITETNPFITFIKEATGESPAMSVLMNKMLEQGYIVRSEG